MKVGLVVELCAIVAAAVFYVALLLTQKGRLLKALGENGGADKKEIPSNKKDGKKRIMVFIVVPILIAVAFLVNYNPYFVILVCALCSLGLYIVCKEEVENLKKAIDTNSDI